MKRMLFLLVAFMGLSMFTSTLSAASEAKPKLDGLTFTSKNGDTLDFYSDFIVYKADGADYSRKGDWSLGGVSSWNGNSAVWRITVNIYVGKNIKTLKGYVTADRWSGKVWKFELDGQVWRL